MDLLSIMSQSFTTIDQRRKNDIISAVD